MNYIIHPPFVNHKPGLFVHDAYFLQTYSKIPTNYPQSPLPHLASKGSWTGFVTMGFQHIVGQVDQQLPEKSIQKPKKDLPETQNKGPQWKKNKTCLKGLSLILRISY